MLKYLLTLFAMVLLPLLEAAEARPTVLVTVAPYKYVVERIAGDTVDVMLMVPAGASAHTYEPSPKQALAASRADLWFILGETFESRIIPSIKAHNPSMEAVDLRQGVTMIIADGSSACCCCAGCQDLHIWLSPREMKTQARTIASTLARRYPQHGAKYQAELDKLLNELDTLDREITDLLAPLKQRLVFVSHPAYAYLCRDYHLQQLSVEIEGKDPTPQQMTRILNEARAAGVTKVYTQPQYSNKGAKLFAAELGAEVVSLDPYAEDYFGSMRQIAQEFSKNGERRP
jgi:zinc transport system substrate-binding protein